MLYDVIDVNKNRTGPRIIPWGTSDVILNHDE